MHSSTGNGGRMKAPTDFSKKEKGHKRKRTEGVGGNVVKVPILLHLETEGIKEKFLKAVVRRS